MDTELWQRLTTEMLLDKKRSLEALIDSGELSERLAEQQRRELAIIDHVLEQRAADKGG